jgi:hypothetical protein
MTFLFHGNQGTDSGLEGGKDVSIVTNTCSHGNVSKQAKSVQNTSYANRLPAVLTSMCWWLFPCGTLTYPSAALIRGRAKTIFRISR